MPITGPTSYVLTVEQFLNHWADANALLGASPLILKKDATGTAADVARAGLVTLQAELNTAREAVEQAALDLALLRGEGAILKAALHAQLNDFNEAVRADHPNSAYAQVLPAVPSINEGRERFLRPLRDAMKLWLKVNTYRTSTGGTALVLKGAVDQGAFSSSVNNLRSKYEAIEEAEQQLALNRQARNDVQDKIYPILKAYRAKLPTLFAGDAAIVATLPALTPSASATPQAPGLSGAWNAGNVRAEFVGVASTSQSVVKHQWRVCLSADYDSEFEQVDGNIDVGDPLTFNVTTGLGVPGSVISVKLYAMTADGHEAGSGPVVIERPV
jgi:hypothetical protein